MDDWINSKRPLKIASIGPGTSLSDVPKLLKAALNLPLEMVEGYKGGAEARLAVESGEVDGLCASWQATKVAWRSQMESGKIHVVLQATFKSHPELKKVPLAISYAKSEEAKTLLRVADNVHVYQFPYSVAPGTPPERVALLRKLLAEILRDPAFVAEVKKFNLAAGFAGAEEVRATVEQAMTTLDEKALAELRDIALERYYH
jgi:tripartite-type tricarboxylate transporter receptor subunit TctC